MLREKGLLLLTVLLLLREPGGADSAQRLS